MVTVRWFSFFRCLFHLVKRVRFAVSGHSWYTHEGNGSLCLARCCFQHSSFWFSTRLLAMTVLIPPNKRATWIDISAPQSASALFLRSANPLPMPCRIHPWRNERVIKCVRRTIAEPLQKICWYSGGRVHRFVIALKDSVKLWNAPADPLIANEWSHWPTDMEHNQSNAGPISYQSPLSCVMFKNSE